MTSRTSFILSEAKNGRLCFFFSALIIFFAVLCAAFAGDARGDWKAEWEKTVEAARKERQLNIYHWGVPSVIDAGVFQKSYPEIKVVTTVGVGTQLMQRILAERRGDKFIADLYIAGIATMAVLQGAKTFDAIKPALVLPEVADESKWRRGKHLYSDAERQSVFTYAKNPDYGSIAYNSKLVEPKEIRSYWDFLQPKWRSKITVQDLRGGGPGTTPLRLMYYHPDLGAKFVKQLYTGMDATLFRDSRLALDGVASGKFAIAYFVQNVEEAETKGLPVRQFKQTLKQGIGLASRVGHIALLNQAPHPNAAKVFINWFLSQEGQITYQKAMVNAQAPADSLRIDIAKDYIPAADRRQEGIKYLDLDDQEYLDVNPPVQLLKELLSETGKK
jgi:iron(III) transport system substrate-binding protein